MDDHLEEITKRYERAKKTVKLNPDIQFLVDAYTHDYTQDYLRRKHMDDVFNSKNPKDIQCQPMPTITFKRGEFARKNMDLISKMSDDERAKLVAVWDNENNQLKALCND